MNTLNLSWIDNVFYGKCLTNTIMSPKQTLESVQSFMKLVYLIRGSGSSYNLFHNNFHLAFFFFFLKFTYSYDSEKYFTTVLNSGSSHHSVKDSNYHPLTKKIRVFFFFFKSLCLIKNNLLDNFSSLLLKRWILKEKEKDEF